MNKTIHHNVGTFKGVYTKIDNCVRLRATTQVIMTPHLYSNL